MNGKSFKISMIFIMLLLCISRMDTAVAPGTTTLTSAVDSATAGDTLTLDPGVFIVTATASIGLHINVDALKIYGA